MGAWRKMTSWETQDQMDERCRSSSLREERLGSPNYKRVQPTRTDVLRRLVESCHWRTYPSRRWVVFSDTSARERMCCFENFYHLTFTKVPIVMHMLQKLFQVDTWRNEAITWGIYWLKMTIRPSKWQLLLTCSRQNVLQRSLTSQTEWSRLGRVGPMGNTRVCSTKKLHYDLED